MTVAFKTLATSILKALEPFPEIHLAIVYGSYATDTASPGSDLDLAVAADLPLSIDLKIAIINQISTQLDLETDLLDLNTATGTVFKEALTTGQVVLKKDPLKLSQILGRMIYEEEDFQKMRRMLMAERRKKAFSVKGS